MKRISTFLPYLFDITADVFLIVIGLFIYTKYEENAASVWLYLGLFIIIKILLVICDSKRKNKIEKFFNIFITALLGVVEFTFLLFIIIKFEGLSNPIEYIKYCILILGMLCITSTEKYLRKKSVSDTILPLVYLLLFVIVFSIIISFVDTSQSAIISAVVTIASLLLTPETLEDVFNAKVDDIRKRQLSLIKISLMALIPIIYISSIIVTPPENTENTVYTILMTGLYRFIILEITFAFLILIIYFKKWRQGFQTFFGLSPDLKYLYGNWNMISINQYTSNEIIVRNFSLNIDGNRINCLGKILTIDNNHNLYNEKQEKVGVIEKINDDRINLNLNDIETKIRLIKMGSKEYREFNFCNKIEDEKFYNIFIPEPITNTKLEVTLFTRQKSHSLFVEANSKTDNKYELKNGTFIQINNIEESDFLIQNSSLGLFESGKFN